MIKVRTIVEFLKGEFLNAWGAIKTLSNKVYGYLGKGFSFVTGKISKSCSFIYDFIMDMSLATKVFISLSVFLCVFLFWQFMTFNVTQPVFVMVNLLLVIISSAFTCYVIFSANSKIQSLNEEIENLEQTKKDKDMEIRGLKSEIHDLNIASRKQQSFGKNSQVLIDTIKKNRKEAQPSDPMGLFLLKSLAQCSDICCGMIYMKRAEDDVFEYAGGYALSGDVSSDDATPREVTKDDAIVGQAIRNGQIMIISDVPSDSLKIVSGLGTSKSMNIYVLPIKYNGEVVAIAEVSSFSKLAVADIWKDIDNVLLNE